MINNMEGVQEIEPREIREDAYVYQPLDLKEEFREFRLLRLLPAKDFHDEVRCELFYSPLEAYEALSYTWGDAEVTIPILLHGIPHPVTTNLELALRYIRYKDRPRIMWVDALCINQKDISEKNHQVAQMREIFLDAERVVVWLGEEGTAQQALDLCKLLQEGKDFITDAGGGILMSQEELAHHLEGFQACDDLFHKRSWWRRTWIVQEVYHTNPVEVYIGKLRVDLDDLARMWGQYFTWSLNLRYASGDEPNDVAFFNVISDIIQPIYIISRERERIQKRDIEPYTLSILTWMFRGQEASDPRDKLFALVGISSERHCFEADYNLPCRDVYVDVTRKLLANTSYPLLQTEALDRSVSCENLPSWVPDYSSRQRSAARVIRLYSSEFAAAPPKNQWTLVDWTSASTEDDGIFCLQGVYVAVVTGVYTERAHGLDGVEGFTLIRYDEDQTIRNEVLDLGDWPSVASEITPYNTSWGPYEAKIGDIIVVAEGCPMPLVLRKHDDFYLLVGPCLLITSDLEGSDLFLNVILSEGTTIFDNGEKNRYTSLCDIPEISDIMRGRTWGNPKYFEGAEGIWESAKEEFRLC